VHKYDTVLHIVDCSSSHLFELHSDSAFTIDNTSEFLDSDDFVTLNHGVRSPII
jgi:hypothetical protein